MGLFIWEEAGEVNLKDLDLLVGKSEEKFHIEVVVDFIEVKRG